MHGLLFQSSLLSRWVAACYVRGEEVDAFVASMRDTPDALYLAQTAAARSKPAASASASASASGSLRWLFIGGSSAASQGKVWREAGSCPRLAVNLFEVSNTKTFEVELAAYAIAQLHAERRGDPVLAYFPAILSLSALRRLPPTRPYATGI